MSELNTYYIPTRSGNSCLCYLKSEADKVIADLEESHKMEVGQLLMEIAELKKQVRDYAQGLYVIQAKAEKEARHHKYKRCLAMAELCCERKENCYNIALRKYTKSEADFLVKKSEFWEEWEDTWTQLAYRFNGAKL